MPSLLFSVLGTVFVAFFLAATSYRANGFRKVAALWDVFPEMEVQLFSSPLCKCGFDYFFICALCYISLHWSLSAVFLLIQLFDSQPSLAWKPDLVPHWLLWFFAYPFSLFPDGTAAFPWCLNVYFHFPFSIFPSHHPDLTLFTSIPEQAASASFSFNGMFKKSLLYVTFCSPG